MKFIQVDSKIHYTVVSSNNKQKAIKNQVLKSVYSKNKLTENLYNIIDNTDNMKKINANLSLYKENIIDTQYKVLNTVEYLGCLNYIDINSSHLTDKTKKCLQKKLKKEHVTPIFFENDENEYLDKFSRYLTGVFCYQTNELVTEKFDENEAFAENIIKCEEYCQKLSKIYKEGDIIIIRSLDLIMLPLILRQNGYDNIIYSFSVEFPTYNMLKTIVHHRKIFESILSANIVEFKSYYSLDMFKKNHTLVHLNHIETSHNHYNNCQFLLNKYGHDSALLDKIRQDPKYIDYLAAVKSFTGKKKLIVNVIDENNYNLTANVYAAMLRLSKKNANICLVNLIDPKMSKEFLTDLESSVFLESLKFKYGLKILNLYYHNDLSFFAHVRMAKVVIYLNRRINTDFKILSMVYMSTSNIIISESGLINGLNQLYIANSYDITGFSKILSCLLSSNATYISEYKNKKTFDEYFTIQVERLLGKSSLDDMNPTQNVDDHLDDLKKIYSSKKIKFFLDYDGTLTPIVKNPNEALLSEETVNILNKLAEKHDVTILTGRPYTFIDAHFHNVKNVNIIAEHGGIIRYGKEWRVMAQNIEWLPLAREIVDFYVERIPGLKVEHKRTAIAVHYNFEHEFYNFHIPKIYETLTDQLSQYDVKILNGKHVLEILPVNSNKGSVISAQNIRKEDYFFCIGDDRTDEDMFSMVSVYDKRHTSIKVGEGETSAKYRIKSVSHLIEFLKNFL